MAMSESRIHYPAPTAIENPELVEYRKEFPILQRKTYLNSCSLGALSERSMQGLTQFMEMWNEWGAHAWYEIWMGEIAKASPGSLAHNYMKLRLLPMSPLPSVQLLPPWTIAHATMWSWPTWISQRWPINGWSNNAWGSSAGSLKALTVYIPLQSCLRIS